MASTTAVSPQTDWRQEWFEFEDATYLNLAGQAPLPIILRHIDLQPSQITIVAKDAAIAAFGNKQINFLDNNYTFNPMDIAGSKRR